MIIESKTHVDRKSKSVDLSCSCASSFEGAEISNDLVDFDLFGLFVDFVLGLLESMANLF